MSQVRGSETVKLHYTGKLQDGRVFDSSVDRDPLEVTLGQGQLIPGFEKGLLNMKENEKKTITIPKEEAYGEVQKELFQKVPNENLPEGIRSEEHTSELQSRPHLVCRLLLEK